MSIGLTTHIAIGMAVGLVTFFILTDIIRVHHIRLYSGIFVVGCGILFALPVFGAWLFKRKVSFGSSNWWSGLLIILCYHLIYLSYIIYIQRILRRRR